MAHSPPEFLAWASKLLLAFWLISPERATSQELPISVEGFLHRGSDYLVLQEKFKSFTLHFRTQVRENWPRGCPAPVWQILVKRSEQQLRSISWSTRMSGLELVLEKNASSRKCRVHIWSGLCLPTSPWNVEKLLSWQMLVVEERDRKRETSFQYWVLPGDVSSESSWVPLFKARKRDSAVSMWLQSKGVGESCSDNSDSAHLTGLGWAIF